MMLEYLKSNNLIICPNNLKKKVIKEINNYNKLISYKIMDLNTFISNYYFSYDKKTIFYLMNKLNLKYDIILEYLDSLIYLNKNNYEMDKLNKLVEIKNDLDNNNLLIYNKHFNYYLNNTNIIIYGYDVLEPFYEEIFNKYKYTHVKSDCINKKHTVYEFDYIDDEIAFICHDIKSKLDSGIDINKIKIIEPATEYINPLNKIFNWCLIPIEIENKISLYDIEVGKIILNKIKSNNTFNDIIDELKANNVNSDILNKIINIFNDYVDFTCNTVELYNMIEYDLKNNYLTISHKQNCVRVISLDEVEIDNYNYILGFNKENYPKIYKDEDFLNDKCKDVLGLFNSNLNNINSLIKLKRQLSYDTNFIITYKLKNAFESYNPCLLIKEEDYTVIKNPVISYNISNFYNQITLAREYDNFYKYGTFSDTLKYLMPNYKDINYRTYNNQFTKIDNNKLLNSLKNPFSLSYSTIDQYYRCSFRYYINNILKIKEENIDDFYMNIGNIFHYVLSQCFNDDFDFDNSWNLEASKYEFTFNKMILLEKLKQELKYDIEILNKQKNYSRFDEFLYEKRFSIPVNNNKGFNVNFVGIVDKISYYKDNNQTLVAVTDYKTGTLPTNLNNIIYGIGMQLPVYLYFVKRSMLFPNSKIVGFYLQKIINKEMKRTVGKTIEELKENALKLVGYSIDDEDLLEIFDMTYYDSQLISSLKKKKEGFYAYSKILSEKEMERMDLIIENKIEEGANAILNGEFSINPKKIDKDVVGCEFCSYRDICFKTEKDYVELPKHKDLDFLRGDSNA